MKNIIKAKMDYLDAVRESENSDKKINDAINQIKKQKNNDKMEHIVDYFDKQQKQAKNQTIIAIIIVIVFTVISFIYW